MTRRSSSATKAIGLVGGLGLFIFAVYSYHNLNLEIKKTSDKADRLRQQHDSLSAQLQGTKLNIYTLIVHLIFSVQVFLESWKTAVNLHFTLLSPNLGRVWKGVC